MLKNRPRRRYRAKQGLTRRCRLEVLERRDLLSSVPPTVVNVEVGSTEWTPAFIEHLQTSNLGTNGFAVPVGSTAQSAILPWTNLDQIMITFSEDVHVNRSHLSLSGVNTAAYEFSGFRYDPQTRVATWTLNEPILRDRLRIDLDGDGIDPVRDLDGNVLDGEWTNNSSTYPSGNSTAGGDFEFTFNVLPTDINNSAVVTYYDYLFINARNGQSAGDANYEHFADVNGSGTIDAADSQAAMNRMFTQLPSGLPAGTNNDAPSTKGLELTQINQTAVDVAIALWSQFDDAEAGSSGLNYSVRSNTNPSLFNAVSINHSTGQLIVNAANGGSGRASITIRATDPGGLHVDAVVTIDVNYQNQPPHISNVVFSNVGAGTWVVEGQVSDPDDDVSNFLVEFYGVFEQRVSVDEDGYFLFAVILEPDEWGMEWLYTFDPHGEKSNTVYGTIGLT